MTQLLKGPRPPWLGFEMQRRLIERLAEARLEPRRILLLSDGYPAHLVKKRFPRAQIIDFYLDSDTLHAKRLPLGLFKRQASVCLKTTHFPFIDGSFDLIILNNIFALGPDLNDLMIELKRIMNKGAALIFSALGPDTFASVASLQDFKASIQASLQDMHDLGDVLNRNFRDAVVDRELNQIIYDDSLSLHQDLNYLYDKSPSLSSFVAPGAELCVEFEFIFGLAWANAERAYAQVNDAGQFEMDPAQIGRVNELHSMRS